MFKSLQRKLLWSLPSALALGALLSLLQDGGWLGFSLLFFLAFILLSSAIQWATDLAERQTSDRREKTLAWIVALAFVLRFAGGVATYLALPFDGYPNDEDDRAGFVFTDARRRDAQAWELAASDKSLFDAFDQKYAYDQYGGLLTFSALTYRYLSPDAHRPLMPVLISALIAALGLPFLWKAAQSKWELNLAVATCWIYALYPESVLLGGSAMREPYLMAFSAFALWGFVVVARSGSDEALSRRWGIFWLSIGVAGMLLVSPAAALATLVILGGWTYVSRAERAVPWQALAGAALVFILGLFLLSAALNRSGEFNSSSPLHVINDWLKLAVQWDVYQLERGSGWVQKLFDEMPGWLRLPFVTVYGIFQPVLPAAFVEPTTLTWKIIAVLRAAGWYALLPVLAAALIVARNEKDKFWLWLTVAVWGWILFAALRGGGDQWDNPRYRAILFAWEALLAARIVVRQRETRGAWLWRVAAMEFVFVAFFGQWYASRYYHWGGQAPFPVMVALILAAWALIFFGGLWRDKKKQTL